MIPLYPSEGPRTQNKNDESLIYYINENLVFDAILNDIYGNKIQTAVNLIDFSADFNYGTDSFQFDKTFHNGIISLTLNDDNN